jgi:multiple sugar transport system substrate-binding protein
MVRAFRNENVKKDEGKEGDINMNKRFFLILMLIMALALVACGGDDEEPTEVAAVEETVAEEPVAEEKPELTALWFAWQPCEALGELAAMYEDATVTVNCVPIAEWYNTTFTDFAAQGGADLTIMDSQWMGEAVTGGHIKDLTEFVAENIEVDDYVPAALSAYGEYPPGSKEYYGVALEGDVQMFVYRKDLYEEAGFEPPETWSELLEQAEYFKDGDAIDNGYVSFWCGTVACYDQMATVWNQMAWSFGGDLWDPETYQVEGILNSPENLEALEFARELFQTGPDGAAIFSFDETVGAVCSGSTAMTTIWFGFGAAFIDPEGCAESENLAFGIVPGEKEHFISLGGMGISVSEYTENEQAALDFIEWVETSEIQTEWAKLGGFTARISILASDEFANAAPYNPAFAESYLLVRDFWNVPEYAALLEPQMNFLNLAVSGQMDLQEALDEIAIQQQEIFDEAYPDGPPN